MENEPHQTPPERRAATTPGHGIHSGLLTPEQVRRELRSPAPQRRARLQDVAREILNRDDRR